jgi:uncharacterized membrane protein YphA (DoxX/SURF4 family)
MSVVLWILQIVLAVVFLSAGLAKLTQPKARLAGSMKWVDDFSGRSVKYIGALEILGALGVVLPWATGVARVLTPIAATGLLVIMVCAMATHTRRKEYTNIGANVVLAALALVVAVARFGDI